jgi:hypothetical protein
LVRQTYRPVRDCMLGQPKTLAAARRPWRHFFWGLHTDIFGD